MLLSNNAFQCVDFAILELLPRILDFFNDAVFKKCLDDLTDNVLNRICLLIHLWRMLQQNRCIQRRTAALSYL